MSLIKRFDDKTTTRNAQDKFFSGIRKMECFQWKLSIFFQISSLIINEKLFYAKHNSSFTQHRYIDVSAKLGGFDPKFWLYVNVETAHLSNSTPYTKHERMTFQPVLLEHNLKEKFPKPVTTDDYFIQI